MGQRAWGRGHGAEGRGQRAWGRGRRAWGRGQRAWGRGHGAEGGGHGVEGIFFILGEAFGEGNFFHYGFIVCVYFLDLIGSGKEFSDRKAERISNALQQLLTKQAFLRLRAHHYGS